MFFILSFISLLAFYVSQNWIDDRPDYIPD